MQIDYPSEEFCLKVEAVASRNARCERKSAASQLQARATLRYEPPGMVVEAHYPDLARCQRENGSMAQGVQIVGPCAPK
jgi:hypothetical protein